jgi:uncharacterized protein (DUF362 family)
MSGRVAVVRTTPETVHDDTARLCELAGMSEALDKGATTILKDNISWHMPYLSANTTPWQLEGTIDALRGAGYDDLVTVHNNTVVTDPVKGGRLNKLTPVYEKHAILELFNFKPEDMGWQVIRPKAKMLALDEVFPEGIQVPDYFFGKNIVHLPTVKCHIYTTTTGAMKNAFGGLLNTHRHYTHSRIHETLVDLLHIQKEIHSGLFCVMDGTMCGDGPGPRTMIPVRADLMLASADQVAIDAVAAKILGFDPLSIKYIRLAHEAGLGCGDPREIEMVGDDVSDVDLQCHVGNNLASTGGHLLWFSPLKRMQHALFHTPVVNAFVGMSWVYHDFVWWPFVGKRIQETVRRNTPWGELFSKL